MGTINMEEQLKRIADALENISQELESINGNLADLGNSASALTVLTECINGYHQLCITGNVTNFV